MRGPLNNNLAQIKAEKSKELGIVSAVNCASVSCQRRSLR